MNTGDYKNEVLGFFDDFIFPFLVGDLQKLESIKANENGLEGCAIPQAMTAFTACDLMGFLIEHQQRGRTIAMKMMPFLKNVSLLPALQKDDYFDEFVASIRDDIRSVMIHRFFLSKFNIGKLSNESVIVNLEGKLTFNVSYFTKIVLDGISVLYQQISDETFKSFTTDTYPDAIKRIHDGITLLKDYHSEYFQKGAVQLPTSFSTTTTQTTSSLG